MTRFTCLADAQNAQKQAFNNDYSCLNMFMNVSLTSHITMKISPHWMVKLTCNTLYQSLIFQHKNRKWLTFLLSICAFILNDRHVQALQGVHYHLLGRSALERSEAAVCYLFETLYLTKTTKGVFHFRLIFPCRC